METHKNSINPSSPDIKNLEFLASLSRDKVERQLALYRQRHSNAGIIIGVSALFIPFFLSNLQDAHKTILYVSLLASVLLLSTIILLLLVLLRKPYHQNLASHRFHELEKESYTQVLVREIDMNNSWYERNEEVFRKSDRIYKTGIRCTISAITISVSLLVANVFFRPKYTAPPVKVEIVSGADSTGSDPMKWQSRGTIEMPQ